MTCICAREITWGELGAKRVYLGTLFGDKSYSRGEDKLCLVLTDVVKCACNGHANLLVLVVRVSKQLGDNACCQRKANS